MIQSGQGLPVQLTSSPAAITPTLAITSLAEKMYDAVRAKGIPVAYVPFEGEQHGFRQAANIRRALEGELWFLSRVFGIPLSEEIAPVAIANADALPAAG